MQKMKPKKQNPLIKLLNKEIEIETKENQRYIGTLEDFDEFSIYLQFKKSENPLVFQLITLEKFKIKSIIPKNHQIPVYNPLQSIISRKTTKYN